MPTTVFLIIIGVAIVILAVCFFSKTKESESLDKREGYSGTRMQRNFVSFAAEPAGGTNNGTMSTIRYSDNLALYVGGTFTLASINCAGSPSVEIPVASSCVKTTGGICDQSKRYLGTDRGLYYNVPGIKVVFECVNNENQIDICTGDNCSYYQATACSDSLKFGDYVLMKIDSDIGDLYVQTPSKCFGSNSNKSAMKLLARTDSDFQQKFATFRIWNAPGTTLSDVYGKPVTYGTPFSIVVADNINSDITWEGSYLYFDPQYNWIWAYPPGDNYTSDHVSFTAVSFENGGYYLNGGCSDISSCNYQPSIPHTGGASGAIDVYRGDNTTCAYTTTLRYQWTPPPDVSTNPDDYQHQVFVGNVQRSVTCDNSNGMCRTDPLCVADKSGHAKASVQIFYRNEIGIKSPEVDIN